MCIAILSTLAPTAKANADNYAIMEISNTPGVGNASAIVVEGNYAYITTWNQSFRIVNISDKTNPTIVATINAPWSTNITSDFCIQGDYAYVLDYGVSPGGPEGGLFVVDISDPESPSIVGSYQLPSGPTVNAMLSHISVNGSYAYVGDWGYGLGILNISDPANPTPEANGGTDPFWDAPFDPPNYNTPATGVFCTGDLTYVAAWDCLSWEDPGGGDAGGVWVYDTSDPTLAWQMWDDYGTWSNDRTARAAKATTGLSYDIAIYNDYAYVSERNNGGAYPSQDGDGGLTIIPIAQVGPPADFGWFGSPIYLKVAGKIHDVYSVYLRDNLAFIADNSNGLSILNVSDPSTINPADPPILAHTTTYGNPYGVYAVPDNGYYIYIADGNGGLTIYYFGSTPRGVENLRTGELFYLIQDAIDDPDTQDGDTIEVDAGTYNESIIINKTLTLLGTQTDVDARGRTGVNESIINGTSNHVVEIQVDDVTINGFTITNNWATNSQIAGIRVQDTIGSTELSGIVIKNNIIHNLSDGLRNGGQGIHGILIGTKTDGVEIAYNEIRDLHSHRDAFGYTPVGILTWGETDGTGDAKNTNVHHNLIYNLTHDNLTCTGGWNAYPRGIQFSNDVWGGIISNNEIHDIGSSNGTAPGRGIRLYPDGNGDIPLTGEGSVNVTNNNVYNCGDKGIMAQFKATITENTITNCSTGVWVDHNGVVIYHNNFINNTNQAYDNSSNTWDNGYPSGGNYWDDFDEPSEGAYDNNSDGIVDSPYNISGGNNQDRYPLGSPWGERPGQPICVQPSDGASGVSTGPTLKVQVTDPNGNTMNVSFYASDGSLIDINTIVASGNITSVTWSSFSYSTSYTWYVIVNDSTYLTRSSNWSFTTKYRGGGGYILPPTNTAPVVDAGGPYSGYVNVTITFNGSGSFDSEGNIENYWSFGDGTTGYGVSPAHVYNSPGTYEVMLTVIDDSGETWSNTTIATITTITIPFVTESTKPPITLDSERGGRNDETPNVLEEKFPWLPVSIIVIIITAIPVIIIILVNQGIFIPKKNKSSNN